ncbi:hypothetical protein TPHA_0H02670 [Tetrapisispora phaffii CBS 4417]|uniref:Uncharacterized protein n=1 Tax=Tetrapisispora phaffii (strain ATCC 24235 / CBS 4417 / NBRC 1672 / NRRL Y-8282 / UCD 70-5) TaxID=1071381 RepID=G8BWL9_TETPH|nr:hypothetical protein TPHA_0H02670 [Tetrapisispora phaffii CBS 4417]CCE64470.1 hypothetical protein TPHA_0H02670 [Tetrapisispora phaffii CBS 4417]
MFRIKTVPVNLGLPHQEDLIVPSLTLETQKSIKKIACGGNHTIILCENEILGCGETSAGQLGDDVSTNLGWKVLFPTRSIIDVACGWEFTVVIDFNNQVLSCGTGGKGELGLGADVTQSDSLQSVFKIPDGYQGKLFSSLQNCILVMTNKTTKHCQIFGWGSNTKEQLFKPKNRKVASPTLIYESQNTTIDYVSMGKDFILLINDHNEVIEARGNLPAGFTISDWVSKQLSHVACMWTSIHIQLEDKIHSFGNNRYGQLLNKQIPNIKNFSTGSEHGIMSLNNPSTISCWGWGEHGNCGPLNSPTRLENLSPHPITTPPNANSINDYSNTISPPNTILHLDNKNTHQVLLQGGYATSWIVIYTSKQTPPPISP